MFYKHFFPKDIPRGDIIKAIKEEGFDPKLLADTPGFVYETHKHPESKLIVCLEGSMKVNVAGKMYDFGPGDKILIPGNTPHGAVVGDKGCVYFWSEKIEY